MEDVLDTYALAPDPDRPLVNLDEFSKQLLSEFIPPRAAKPSGESRRGTSRRQDSEYVREGSASAFMIAAPHLGCARSSSDKMADAPHSTMLRPSSSCAM